MQPGDAEDGIDPGGSQDLDDRIADPTCRHAGLPSPADPGMRRCGHGTDCRQSCQNAGVPARYPVTDAHPHRRRPIDRWRGRHRPRARRRPHRRRPDRGDRATRPGPRRSRRRGSRGPPVTRIDGAGKTLLPGLIDAHAHYTFDPTEGSIGVILRRSDAEIVLAAAGHAAVALRAGVTTARGAGSLRNLEVALRDAIDAGARARSADPDGGHSGRHHRRARLPVRAGGGQPGGLRDRDAPGRPRRRGRGQGDRLGGGHAHDHRPRRKPDRQRRAGADRSTSCGRSWRPPPSSASRS